MLTALFIKEKKRKWRENTMTLKDRESKEKRKVRADEKLNGFFERRSWLVSLCKLFWNFHLLLSGTPRALRPWVPRCPWQLIYGKRHFSLVLINGLSFKKSIWRWVGWKWLGRLVNPMTRPLSVPNYLTSDILSNLPFYSQPYSSFFSPPQFSFNFVPCPTIFLLATTQKLILS